jgi:hypothetical protein
VVTIEADQVSIKGKGRKHKVMGSQFHSSNYESYATFLCEGKAERTEEETNLSLFKPEQNRYVQFGPRTLLTELTLLAEHRLGVGECVVGSGCGCGSGGMRYRGENGVGGWRGGSVGTGTGTGTRTGVGGEWRGR